MWTSTLQASWLICIKTKISLYDKNTHVKVMQLHLLMKRMKVVQKENLKIYKKIYKNSEEIRCSYKSKCKYQSLILEVTRQLTYLWWIYDHFFTWSGSVERDRRQGTPPWSPWRSLAQRRVSPPCNHSRRARLCLSTYSCPTLHQTNTQLKKEAALIFLDQCNPD